MSGPIPTIKSLPLLQKQLNAYLTAAVSPLRLLSYLTDIPSLTPRSGEDAIIVGAYSNTSPTCPAIYERVAGDPGHALAAQDADGDWWAIDGSLGLNVQVAGLDAGDDLAGVLATVLAASPKAIIPALGFTLSQVDLTLADRAIEAMPGNLITAEPGSSALNGIQIKADNITFDGLNFSGVKGTSAAASPDIDRWIYCPRPGSTYPTRQLVRKGVKLLNCTFTGGNKGFVGTNMADLTIDNCTFDWAIAGGLALTGQLISVKVNNTRIRYNGCAGASGAGGVVIGQAAGSGGVTIRDVQCTDCQVLWNGWYADGGPQSGVDMFANSVDTLLFANCIIANNGDCIEVKKQSDTTSGNSYRNINFVGNTFLQMMPGTSMVTIRHLSDGSPASDASDTVTTCGLNANAYINDPVSKVVTLGSNAIATTLGSQVVNVNITAHGGRDGELIKILGVDDIGGVPAYQLQTERQIHVVDADNFSFPVETAATSTATGGSWGVFYCQFRTPVAVTADFANTSNFLTIHKTAHGAAADDAVDLSGFSTTAGIDATWINTRFRIYDVPTANTFRVYLAVPATSTVSGAAGAMRIRLNNGVTALDCTAWANFSSQGNSYTGMPTAIDFSGIAGSPGEPLLKPIFQGESFKNVGQCFKHHAGAVNNAQFGGSRGWCYEAFFISLNGAGQLLVPEFVDNAVEVMSGFNSTGFINGTNIINGKVRNCRSIVAGYPITFNGPSASSLRFEGNDFSVDNPVSPGTGKSALSAGAMNLADGGAYEAFNNTYSTANAAQRGIALSGGSTCASGNNKRGYVAADPTGAQAGSEGDIFYCSPTLVGQALWQCTTAGTSGAAVWTPR